MPGWSCATLTFNKMNENGWRISSNIQKSRINCNAMNTHLRKTRIGIQRDGWSDETHRRKQAQNIAAIAKWSKCCWPEQQPQPLQISGLLIMPPGIRLLVRPVQYSGWPTGRPLLVHRKTAEQQGRRGKGSYDAKVIGFNNVDQLTAIQKHAGEQMQATLMHLNGTYWLHSTTTSWCLVRAMTRCSTSIVSCSSSSNRVLVRQTTN